MHSILSSYPGVRLLHRDPDVFVVDEFFSAQERAILLSLGREEGKLRRDEVIVSNSHFVFLIRARSSRLK